MLELVSGASHRGFCGIDTLIKVIFQTTSYAWRTQVRWASTNGAKYDCFCPWGGWSCASIQVGFGIRGGLLGYFLSKQKVTKEIVDFILGVATPNPQYFLTRYCFLFLGLVDCYAVVLTQKVFKKVKAYGIFTTSYVCCIPRNLSQYATLHTPIACTNPTQIQLQSLVTQKTHLPFRILHRLINNHRW